MSSSNQGQLVNFIWSICNLLRGPYKRNEYRKVILPLTVLRRFDAILEPTKAEVLRAYEGLKGKPESVVSAQLRLITRVPFYNLSKLSFRQLIDDPNQVAPNLNSYINAFSPNVRQIFEKFEFGIQVHKMDEKNLLYQVIKKFASADLNLTRDAVDDLQMGYVFEELIRIGAEQSNEEAGEHFTPREVIELMVNLLFSPEGEVKSIGKSHVVKTIYDPACGTGGMLSVAESHIRRLNTTAQPHLFGQDWNDEAWAICRSDMLIKGEESDNIKAGDTFLADGFPQEKFDYMLANPPFGVEWKQQEKAITDEHTKLGFDGRFGAGLPRINDGSLLFLMHMLSKMRPLDQGGSRLAIVFNGSPLFTGDAGSGESSIRQWILENDWLEAVVALPDQLFYNTGISTYLWILTNGKELRRRGKVQLIDARDLFVKMRKSLGNKRNQIGDGRDKRPDQIAEITRIHGTFAEGPRSKIFDNDDFGYRKITVERPLRLSFSPAEDRIARLSTAKAWAKVTAERQQSIVETLRLWAGDQGDKVIADREVFLKQLKARRPGDGAWTAPEVKLVVEALGERDEAAAVCLDSKGQPEADPDLRDTENVPLKQDVDEYFTREVKPHLPDAWVDHAKTKIGYEIPLNRHFYRYEPPRPLEAIEADIVGLEAEIMELLAQVTGSRTGGSR